MNESQNLWNKPLNEMTLKDSLKINLVVVAVMAAVPVTMIAVNSVSKKLNARKLQKLEENIQKRIEDEK